MISSEWLKTNESLRRRESKTCSYQLVLVGYSLFEQCLFVSLTFLIHQQGFWSTLWNMGIHLRFPFQTYVEFLVEKWKVGRKQSSRTGFWVGISQEHTVMRLLHTFPRAILNEVLWHLKTPCDGEKTSLRKQASKQAKRPQWPTAVFTVRWGKSVISLQLQRSLCMVMNIHPILYFKSGPLPPRDWLWIHSPPALPGSPPYCLRVKNVFWCRAFHWSILTCRWRHWQQREADCPSWRTTRTVSPVCSFLHSFLKNSVP